MRLWVFSDLHLEDPQSAFYQSFLKVLDEPESEQDTVVLAGDIFDLMVGKSRYFSQKHADFFNKLRALARKKVRLYYIEGNHDFHIQKQFEGIPIRFEEESVKLEVQTAQSIKRIYIAHGDLVDESDTGYLALRKLFRSSPVQAVLGLLPGRLIEAVGEKWSRPHQQKGNDLPEKWSPEALTRLRSIYRGFAQAQKDQGFDYIILGHCHDFDEIEPFYFNMGYPPVHGCFIFYDSLDDCVKRKSLRK
jgi:UDP-2,3-diacylglucosamine hydrolase